MARIRSIKPEFWEDEKIAKLSLPCRLFFIGTWNLADDNGVFRANTSLLKAKLFPYDDDLKTSEIQKFIDALIESKMLVPITHNKENYYLIRTFHSHQKFDARYPNYLIDKDVLKDILSKNVPPQSPRCAPDGSTPRDGDGMGGEEGEGEGVGEPVEQVLRVTTPSEISIHFSKFNKWIKDNAPMVAKMKYPFTLAEFERLKSEFTLEQITSMILTMHNYKPLLTKCVSANLTFRKWIKKETNGSETVKLPNQKMFEKILSEP